jgi:Protein of unknown function (DUF2934)
METQVDPSPRPKHAKSNSHSQIVKNTQPPTLSTTPIRVPPPDVDPLTEEQRRELIAVTAYYLAESRNFEAGHEDEDWNGRVAGRGPRRPRVLRKKAPLAGPFSASRCSARGKRQAAAANNCQSLGVITVSIA